MPELPEVETTRRGIIKPLKNKRIIDVIVRQPQLRWPLPKNLARLLKGKTLQSIHRRGKYLIFNVDSGHMLLHLGMSGRLRVLPQSTPPQKHDHVDFHFNEEICLRYTDPRRFGSIHWVKQSILQHPLLKNLGPEPLSKKFHAKYLYEKSRNRNVSIKKFIMNSQIVVGVGNIYANEALFIAGISPMRLARTINLTDYEKLVTAIQQILRKAIKAGGTTLKDFYQIDGKPGYFVQELLVYGRDQQPCYHCGKEIFRVVQNQRATYYCNNCQK